MTEIEAPNALVPQVVASVATQMQIRLPGIVSVHGRAARFAWDEYFSGKIRNPHTRKAYLHAVRCFLSWCELHDIELLDITPGMIGRYFDLHPGSAPTKKLHMSAIRGLFDTLVLRHVIVLNPALSVKTERLHVMEGKTPEVTVEQARKLRESIELVTPIDYRDRAIVSMLIYTAARVGAIAKLRFGDLRDEAVHWSIQFREKGGKQRLIPARIDLQADIQMYLAEAFHQPLAKDATLFRTALGRTGNLSNKPMSAIDICRMVKRRLKKASLPEAISPHSFRSCAATDLLLQGVPLEDVQYLLGHSDARVTRLYDRRQRKVTRNIVERISV